MRVAVVPAAGLGKRFGGKKQFFTVMGKKLLEYPLLVMEKSELVDGVILVLPAQDLETGRELQSRFRKVVKIVEGGKERQHSVYRGLLAAKELSPQEVFVHDGVRPLITPALLNDLVVALSDYQVEGVIPAVKPKETVKEAGAPLEPGDFMVNRTLNRDKLLLAQTPQLFRFDVLLECHRKALEEEFIATDDSALIERYGYQTVAIPGDYRNIKVTTPEDLKIVELFLKEFYLV
ncbi:2-C-methyl-D-erythritol 4-phosphate cytidylyltransferase [Thermovibrio ammonificans HB-1]|uniref:2-C-methyl-D-erythritol 4-phosphate cytidylyltransferase n=1 Tax=Thermovibrio ammonificans (strain DSM 15698 / JCM 12110 / HB-1) TaxID=648996 RepID=E8T3P0_THEA1|nr:2-C-methyl-D-erythritol 4-phosphate cytidylyltransferase [Thermovibrio ammonificans]ADU97297.1 2-C-methyl-D-erythritol 4-phosphate cytidylyltransferase [Thermovibrio ammonificans HB-1]